MLRKPKPWFFIGALLTICLLSACSGGDPASLDQSTASPQLLASTKNAGPLEVVSKFKKGVKRLAPNAFPVLSSDAATIVFAKAPRLNVGDIFIALDRAYVARGIERNRDGSITVGVSQADFGDVFEQFSLKGELSFGYDNIDRGLIIPATVGAGNLAATSSNAIAKIELGLERAVADDGSQGVKATVKFPGTLANGSTFEVGGSFAIYNLKVKFDFNCILTCGSVGGSNDLSVSGRFDHSLETSLKLSTKETMPPLDVFLYRYLIPIPATGFTVFAYVPVYLRTSISGEFSLVTKTEGTIFMQYSTKGATAPTSAAAKPTAAPTITLPALPTAAATLEVGAYLAAKPSLVFLGLPFLVDDVQTGARATVKAFPGTTTSGQPTGRMCATGVGRLVAETEFTVGWAHFSEIDLFGLIGYDPSLPQVDFAPNCNEGDAVPTFLGVEYVNVAGGYEVYLRFKNIPYNPLNYGIVAGCTYYFKTTFEGQVTNQGTSDCDNNIGWYTFTVTGPPDNQRAQLGGAGTGVAWEQRSVLSMPTGKVQYSVNR
jgi:hypothetical protein